MTDEERNDIVAQGFAASARIEQRLAARQRASERDPLVATLPIATDEEKAQVQAAFDKLVQLDPIVRQISDATSEWMASMTPVITTITESVTRLIFPARYLRKVERERAMRLRAARQRARQSTQVRRRSAKDKETRS